MSDAIHPDYFGDFRKIVNKEPEDVPVKEEQQICWMSKQPGWKHIETYIKDLIDSLDLPAKQAMETGCSYDEIGRKTIVAQLTKEFLNKILDKVHDAKEAIDPDK